MQNQVKVKLKSLKPYKDLSYLTKYNTNVKVIVFKDFTIVYVIRSDSKEFVSALFNLSFEKTIEYLNSNLPIL